MRRTDPTRINPNTTPFLQTETHRSSEPQMQKARKFGIPQACMDRDRVTKYLLI
jgi:hypothetical protein